MSINFQRLLQGRYEAERLPKDFSAEQPVPDFAFNVLNPLGLLYRPVSDERYLANGGEKPIWPQKKPFAVCLTHDVDWVTRHSFKQATRARSWHFLNATSSSQVLRTSLAYGRDLISAGLRIGQTDPLHCYERWLDAEKHVAAHSTFFFWPGFSNVTKHHHSDCSYELTDRLVFNEQKTTVAGMIQEIDHRGWEIGLHASWYSFNDVDEMKRQKEALETALGHEVVSVRQHYLHHDIRVTPHIHSSAGLLYDATLGFNDNIGFRFGTSYPWKLYDLREEQELPITEVPLIIQDIAMFNPNKGMRLDEDTAFQYIVQLTEAVERVGGVLTLLWHPETAINRPLWDLYLRSLACLQEKNAWFASVKEIGETSEHKNRARLQEVTR